MTEYLPGGNPVGGSVGAIPVSETLGGKEIKLDGNDALKVKFSDDATYVTYPGGVKAPASAVGVGSVDNTSSSSDSDSYYDDSSDSYSESSDSYSESSSSSSESSSTSTSKGVTRKPIKVTKDNYDEIFWRRNQSMVGGGTVSKPAITGIGSREIAARIAVNKSNLEANSQKIKAAASKLDSIWNEIKVNQIGRINDSWVGSAAEEYTSKVLNMEPKVNAVKEALQLIAKSYDAAINEIDSKQSQLTSKIKGI